MSSFGGDSVDRNAARVSPECSPDGQLKWRGTKAPQIDARLFLIGLHRWSLVTSAARGTLINTGAQNYWLPRNLREARYQRGAIFLRN